MNLKLVRAVDRYVGIPACFILSGLYKLFSCLKDKKSQEEQCSKRILFVELSEMGSVILAYPSMQYILKKYPGASIYFLIFEQNRFSVDILEIMPRNHVLTISTLTLTVFLRSTIAAIRSIRKAKINMVFDLELFSRFSSLLTGLSGAQTRVGYSRYHEEGLYRGSFLTHPVMYNCHQHMAKNFLALVKSVEYATERPLLKDVIKEPLSPPTYIPRKGEKEAIMDRLAMICPAVKQVNYLVVLNPGAGTLLPIRAWPLDYYVDLGKTILKHFSTVLIVIGLSEAANEGARITKELGSKRCIDITGSTTVSELFALLSQASLLITADSGPAHFATLTDIPSIVLFGPETPALYAPLGSKTICLFAGLACSPCLSAYNHRKSTCRNPKCMRAITVNQVFDTICRTIFVSTSPRKKMRHTQKNYPRNGARSSQHSNPSA